jgi:hypothetical protein
MSRVSTIPKFVMETAADLKLFKLSHRNCWSNPTALVASVWNFVRLPAALSSNTSSKLLA